MNHILDYDGYRFFQSSYDNDELGTYLSVNHDYWGTLFSYLGYFLLTIGMVMTFFMKNSRFTQLIKKLQDYQKSVIIFCLLSLSSVGAVYADATSPIPADHAAEFGKLFVQDFNGRIKPMNTHSSEILRKVAKKSSIGDLSSDQVLLSMLLFLDNGKKKVSFKYLTIQSLKKY
jgi:hypothetical protein